MFRFNNFALVGGTFVLLTLILTGRAATAQTFTWNGRALLNSPSASGVNHSAWNRTNSGRLTLSQPKSAQGRLRLSQPTSAQGRMRLAPSADPQGRLRLQTQSNSSRARSGQQGRVERFIQEQLRQNQAERARRQKIVERLFSQPAETTVMPLSTGKPQPVTVMPLESKPATPQPTVLIQFAEVTSTEDDE